MFFQSSLNTRADEIRSYIPVSVATSFSNVSPLIGSAENKYILPLLGQELYDQVHSYYQDKDNPPDGVTEGNKAKFDQLIKHIQRSLINLTYYTGFEFLSVTINDAGFHRQESNNEKSLYKYQEDAIKQQFMDAGFNGLDTMLEYIESYPDVFPKFTLSPAYTLRKSSFIPSTFIFNQLIDINSSRLVFLKLRRFIDQVEEFTIKSVLGSGLYSLAKTEIAKSSPDSKILALVPYIQKPLAHLAMAEAFKFLGVNVRDRGVFFNAVDTTMVNSSRETPADINSLNVLIRAETDTGNAYLGLLKDFLLENADDYPTGLSDTTSPYIRSNSDKTTFWV